MNLMVSVELLLYAVLRTSILTLRGDVSAGLHAQRAAWEGAGAGTAITSGARAGALPRKGPGAKAIPGAKAGPGAAVGVE